MKYLVLLFAYFIFNAQAQSDFGNPSNPTYGLVQSNIPQDYYQEANGKSSDELKEALHQIISNHVVYPYTSSSTTDTWDILQLSDQDPDNHDNMILLYTGRSQDKGYRDGSGNYSQYENGNGTQNIFYDNQKVLYISTHQYPYYPGSGSNSERGKYNNILNIPLPAGTNSREYLDAYEHVLRKIKEFKPEFLLFSAGFDAHKDDPLAQLQLNSKDYYEITKRTLNCIKNSCKGKVVSILEGGYDLNALKESSEHHINALIEFN